MNPFDDKPKPTEPEFRCCMPGCEVAGPKSGTGAPLCQLGDGHEAHILCYPHLATWYQAQGAELKRAPNGGEWLAFLAWWAREAA